MRSAGSRSVRLVGLATGDGRRTVAASICERRASTAASSVRPSSIRRRAYSVTTDGCALMRSTCSGCVYEGSSVSLWPKRR